MEALNYNSSHPPGLFHWERRRAKMRVNESIRKCVVFIGMVNPGGDFVAYGTGFIISVFPEDVKFDYIVTCNHVLNEINGDKICIRINDTEGGADKIETSKREWVIDEKHDVAILSRYLPPSKYDISFSSNIEFATIEKIKELEIEPGESAYLVGLFISHYGSNRNMPIVRVGNIAAIPEDPVFTSVGYMKGYLVEMRSIGGFSGSPVFVNIMPCRIINNIMMHSAELMGPYLLGMMQGLYVIKEPSIYPKYNSEADAMNAGIGIVIPIETIMQTIKDTLLYEQREKTLKQIKKQSGVRPATAKTLIDTDNPQHKEDFNSLLTAAVKKKPPADET
jgi:hypothetical protein